MKLYRLLAVVVLSFPLTASARYDGPSEPRETYFPAPATNGAPDPKIQAAIARITPESTKTVLQGVLSYGARYSDADRKKFATSAAASLRSLGYEVTMATSGNLYNVEAVLKGSTLPDERCIVLGHMDTVSPSVVGADDNSSGTAGVLELARVFAGSKPTRSLVFLLTDSEEAGLVGSHDYVSALKSSGQDKKVRFVINMDMIGYTTGKNIVDLETNPPFKAQADWMAEQAQLYTGLKPHISLNAWGSDHVPFIQDKIPTLLTIEYWDEVNPCYHQSCDTMDTIHLPYMADILRLNMAAMIQQAGVEFP